MQTRLSLFMSLFLLLPFQGFLLVFRLFSSFALISALRGRP